MNTYDMEILELTVEELGAVAGGAEAKPCADFKVLGVRFEFWPVDIAATTWWDGREVVMGWFK